VRLERGLRGEDVCEFEEVPTGCDAGIVAGWL